MWRRLRRIPPDAIERMRGARGRAHGPLAAEEVVDGMCGYRRHRAPPMSACRRAIRPAVRCRSRVWSGMERGSGGGDGSERRGGEGASTERKKFIPRSRRRQVYLRIHRRKNFIYSSKGAKESARSGLVPQDQNFTLTGFEESAGDALRQPHPPPI
jgi:hypothetical protein